MKMMYSPSFDPAKAYRDKRYKKMELYRYALQAYFEGDKKSSFKYFKDMQEGSNCINCRYNVCVEALLGKALMLEDEGKYDEALKCLERISEESFDPHLINEFAKKIKEKM
jgi:tetratricopeptide (TPR) repeat protein